MTPKDRNLWLDLMASRYLTAFEADDFDAQRQLWEVAEGDAELAEAFHELHLGLIEEQRTQDKQLVRSAVAAAMPAAAIVNDPTGPVTVADVAEEVFRTAGPALSAEGYVWNDKLRASAVPLPDELGLSRFSRWAEATLGPAPAGFWAVFQKQAMKLERGRASEVDHRLAARRAPKPEGDG